MHIDDGRLRVLHLEPEGEIISTPEQVSDLIGNAWYEHADVIAVPVGRLDPEFFRLKSGLAGELTQKIVNYRLILAVIGDIDRFTSASDALSDFVWESNRGNHVWFLADQSALEARLAPKRQVADRDADLA